MDRSTIQRIDILESFERLKNSQKLLCNSISTTDNTLPVWQESQIPSDLISLSDINKSRRSITQHINKLWYLADDTLRLPGLIASSADTLALLQSLNGEKALFEKLMVTLRKDLKAPGAKLTQLLSHALGNRDEDIQQLLQAVGMTGINLSLCYRRFQQLPDTIESVSWTWSMRSRSIKTLTIEDSMELATARYSGTETFDSIRAKLGTLDPSEPLALVKPVQPTLKANIVFRDAERRTVRKLITAHSPLFYQDTGQGLPRLKWPGYPDLENLPPRLSRSKRFIQNKPFIRSLNLYRYIH